MLVAVDPVVECAVTSNVAVVMSGGSIPETVRDDESIAAQEGIQVAPERTAVYEAVERHLEMINSGKELEKLVLA